VLRESLTSVVVVQNLPIPDLVDMDEKEGADLAVILATAMQVRSWPLPCGCTVGTHQSSCCTGTSRCASPGLRRRGGGGGGRRRMDNG